MQVHHVKLCKSTDEAERVAAAVCDAAPPDALVDWFPLSDIHVSEDMWVVAVAKVSPPMVANLAHVAHAVPPAGEVVLRYTLVDTEEGDQGDEYHEHQLPDAMRDAERHGMAVARHRFLRLDGPVVVREAGEKPSFTRARLVCVNGCSNDDCIATRDATAYWDVDAQRWVMNDIDPTDEPYCSQCGGGVEEQPL